EPSATGDATVGDELQLKNGTKGRLFLIQAASSFEATPVFAGTDANIKVGKKEVPVFGGTDFHLGGEGIAYQAWFEISSKMSKGKVEGYAVQLYHGPQVDKSSDDTGYYVMAIIGTNEDKTEYFPERKK